MKIKSLQVLGNNILYSKLNRVLRKWLIGSLLQVIWCYLSPKYDITIKVAIKYFFFISVQVISKKYAIALINPIITIHICIYFYIYACMSNTCITSSLDSEFFPTWLGFNNHCYCKEHIFCFASNKCLNNLIIDYRRIDFLKQIIKFSNFFLVVVDVIFKFNIFKLIKFNIEYQLYLNIAMGF